MAPLEHEILDEKGNTMAALTSICNGVHFLTATDNAEVELDVKVPKRKRDPEGNILYDDRGRPLIEPPDPNTGDYDKEALKVPIHTNFTVKLVKDDIVVVLPSNSYNSDPCRLLLFKANYSASPDSYQGTNSNGKYFFYVLELNTYDASAEFTDVAYEEVMPEYIDDNNILDFINDYAKCEREYYTKASGLMDGYFCEPHEWQDMGDYRTVTKWKMSSDVDTAAERGIPIDVGSRYFRGHLLGRGEFLDQPFGTTEPEEANYQGKATYFYDAIQNSAGALLDNVTIPYEEWQTRAGSQVVALDGVAIVVNTANGVEDLTVDQIAQIFKGEITNWSELGGADGEIAVFGREAGSGTRGAFEEIVGVVDSCTYTNEYSSTGDVIGNVASNPNAIGYASLSAVGDTVKAVKVNGVTPSEATVKDGTYEIQRPFVMVTKEGTELSEAAQAFLDFALSADSAEFISAAGAVSPNA